MVGRGSPNLPRVSAQVDGLPFDMWEESQRPWGAHEAREQREQHDEMAASRGKCPRFTKLDFINLVLSKAMV